MTPRASRRDDPETTPQPVEASPTDGEPRALGAWAAIVGAAVICLTIGLPLAGLGVFHASDLLLDHAPWDVKVPPSFEPSNPLLGDTVNNELPMHAEYRRRLHDRDFPLWLSFPSGGRPLGTVPDAGALGPLAAPYVVAPLWYAPALSKLLEMLLAGGFAYLFLRRLGLGRAAAIVGGLAYMTSGFQVVWTNWPQPRVGAWIPALFWALERGLQERRLRSFLPVPLITAAMIFEGFPSVAGYALLAAALYVLVRAGTARRSLLQRVRSIGAPAAAVVLGLGLAAIQLLPLAERLGELDLGYRVQSPESHLPLMSAATAAVPNALGSPADQNYFGPLNYVEIQSFIGVVALLLVGIAVVRSRRITLPPGVRPFLWTATAVAALVTFVGGPLLEVFQTLWLFRMNPVGRVRSVLGFFVACLAAVGFESLLRQAEGRSARGRALAVAFWVLATGAVLFAAWRVWLIAGLAGQRNYLLSQSLVPAVAGLAAIVALALGRRIRIHGAALAVWLLPALVAVESTAFARGFLPRIERESFYPSTPAHAFLREHLGGDRFASGGLAMAPGTSSYYRLRSLTSNTFYPPTWAEAVALVDDDAFANSPLLPVLDSTPEVATSPVLDRLGVRYFVVPPEALFGDRTPLPPAPGSPVAVGSSPAIVGSVPAGRIRGISVRVVGLTGSLRPLRLHAELLDPFGRTVASGSRRVIQPALGPILVPVSEPDPASAAGRLRIRLSTSGIGTTLSIARDADGEAAVGTIIAADDGLRLVFVGGVLIYERLNALPRIRWAGGATVLPERRARLMALGQAAVPGSVLLSASGPSTDGGEGVVEMVDDGGDELLARVRASAEGYLVVADAMQDGWTATVDGRVAEVRDAEHAGVAVLVPAGLHQVRFRYQPAGWRAGLLLTGVSVVLFVLLAVWLAVSTLVSRE